METAFRTKIQFHLAAQLPASTSFRSYNTSPFVLLIHAALKHYSHVHEIERDILPAKQFSSMETSAGRMVEEVVLPVYGWECVPSGMHSANSALDGRKLGSSPLCVATLKSGPRCLNDEMSANFADDIIDHAAAWAGSWNAEQIDFTYGVLYGTQKQSNKKDWHILRNLRDKVPAQPQGRMIVSPDGRWDCEYVMGALKVRASVRIGIDWWTHLGGRDCLVEVLCALVRACIMPTQTQARLAGENSIPDLAEIISLRGFPSSYNVSVLQRSQLPWLFLMASHFCDELA